VNFTPFDAQHNSVQILLRDFVQVRHLLFSLTAFVNRGYRTYNNEKIKIKCTRLLVLLFFSDPPMTVLRRNGRSSVGHVINVGHLRTFMFSNFYVDA
jgi:hypothetical protein